jgi:site-specific DNA recombinase
MRSFRRPDDDSLVTWAVRRGEVTPQRFRVEDAGLRFAFHGRMSTVDHQDRLSSWSWQRETARELVAGHGRVVVEFFDTGVSRGGVVGSAAGVAVVG